MTTATVVQPPQNGHWRVHHVTTGPPIVPAPPELAARLFELLDVDPTTTR